METPEASEPLVAQIGHFVPNFVKFTRGKRKVFIDPTKVVGVEDSADEGRTRAYIMLHNQHHWIEVDGTAYQVVQALQSEAAE